MEQHPTRQVHAQLLRQTLNNYGQFNAPGAPSDPNGGENDGSNSGAGRRNNVPLPPSPTHAQSHQPPLAPAQQPSIPRDEFVEATLRSYSQGPSAVSSTLETFMMDLLHHIENAVTTHILTPFPPEFKLELLKKNNVPFPTTPWSGENDLEKFKNWMTGILSWISGNGWRFAVQ